MTTSTVTPGAAFWRDIKTLPNLLCVYRLVGIYVGIGIFYLGYPLIALALGITAGLTDYFDGYFARKWNQVTELGSLLDTVADLLFAFIVLCTAIDQGVWPLYLLVLWGLRDISVLSIRTSAAQQGFSIPSIYLGKLASNFLFYSFVIMPIDFAQPFGSEHWMSDAIHYLGLFGIHAGILLQWITAVVYFRRFIAMYQPQSRANGPDKQES